MINSDSEPTHAGAIIFRKNKRVEILLTKRVGGEVPGFFLTQGHIEKRENPKETAQREIVEETGIRDALRIKDLGILTRKGLADDGIWYKKVIHFFLFETKETSKSQWEYKTYDNKVFQQKFFPIIKAIKALYFKEEKALLKYATSFFKQ